MVDACIMSVQPNAGTDQIEQYFAGHGNGRGGVRRVLAIRLCLQSLSGILIRFLLHVVLVAQSKQRTCRTQGPCI